jgi:hypothetical protein
MYLSSKLLIVSILQMNWSADFWHSSLDILLHLGWQSSFSGQLDCGSDLKQTLCRLLRRGA